MLNKACLNLFDIRKMKNHVEIIEFSYTVIFTDARTIYVSELSRNITVKDLHEDFQSNGTIRQITIICKIFDDTEDRNNGYAYIEFDEESEVKRTLRLNRGVIDEHIVKVEKKWSDACTIFVGNLPDSITEDALRNHFQSYGVHPYRDIHSVTIKNGKKGKYAFMHLAGRDFVERALQANESHLDGKRIR
ncbi:7081_t:CDS:2, partial [Dentiscutata erythropus]